MYESPINLWSCQINDEVAKKYAEHTENLIYQEVLNVGVSVDRKELIKALQYDRGQYDKGYADGYVAGYEAAKFSNQTIVSMGGK